VHARELGDNADCLSWCGEGVVVFRAGTATCQVRVESDEPALGQACRHVAGVANDIGVGMAAMYDGSTPYPPFASDTEDAA